MKQLKIPETQKGNPHLKSTTVTSTESKGKNSFLICQRELLSGQASRPSLLAPLCRRQLQTPKHIKDKQRGTRKRREEAGLALTLQDTPTGGRPDACSLPYSRQNRQGNWFLGHGRGGINRRPH